MNKNSEYSFTKLVPKNRGKQNEIKDKCLFFNK